MRPGTRESTRCAERILAPALVLACGWMLACSDDRCGTNVSIYYNDDFEFPDEAFDLVIARSIWTHAGKAMISKMLAEFAENSSANARFLTSVIFVESEEEDNKGSAWVGRILKSDKEGFVRHSSGWIRDECARYGLSLDVKEDLHKQTWLLITKGPG
jgi:hypothetical protein